MYVFDTLGHNPGRHTDSMLYSRDNYQLMLVDNTAMFGTSGKRPAYLQNVALKVGDYWTGSLQLLTAATLNEQLGDVLDKRRVKALLKRRDRILSGIRAGKTMEQIIASKPTAEFDEKRKGRLAPDGFVRAPRTMPESVSPLPHRRDCRIYPRSRRSHGGMRGY